MSIEFSIKFFLYTFKGNWVKHNQGKFYLYLNKKEDDPSIMTLEVCEEEKEIGYKLSHG